MFVWMGLVLAVAGVLIVGTEWLMRRFGVRPERPQETSGGLRDVLERIEQWQEDYARRRNSN